MLKTKREVAERKGMVGPVEDDRQLRWKSPKASRIY